MQDFRKLKVWEKSHAVVLSIYVATAGFPSSELYGLTAQMRRCCISIPSNIAEGCGRGSKADLLRFLHIAMGSAKELEYPLLAARDLGFLTPSRYEEHISELGEVERMLCAYRQTQRRKVTPMLARAFTTNYKLRTTNSR